MPERGRILVIDDEPQIVRGLSVRLRAAGYQVHTAGNGAEGLEMVAAAAPDGILLDVQMPAMDGLRVLEILRTRTETRSIPVIVLSANVAEQVRARALAAGAYCVMDKPFQAARLLATIAAAIAGRAENGPILNARGEGRCLGHVPA